MLNDDEKERVSVKLFVGFTITSEVKMYLHESHAWQLARTTPTDGDLCEVRHKNNYYIGRYLPDGKMKVSALKEQESYIEAKLREYCPTLPTRAYRFSIFSQLFIQ